MATSVSESNSKSLPSKVISKPARSSVLPTIILPILKDNESAGPDGEIPK